MSRHKIIDAWTQSVIDATDEELEGMNEEPRPRKKKSTAYVCGDHATVPCINPPVETDEQYAMLVALCLHSKVKAHTMLPPRPCVPMFWIVGTDKEAIKKELAKRVDAMFEACDMPVRSPYDGPTKFDKALLAIDRGVHVTLHPDMATKVRIFYGKELKLFPSSHFIQTEGREWAKVGDTLIGMNNRGYDY